MRDSPTPTMGSVSSAVFRQPTPLITHQTPKTEGALSRTPSTRTLTQSRIIPPSSPAPSAARTFNTAFGNHRKPISPQREISEPDSDAPLQDSESDSSSDGESQSMARSQAFRRPSTHHNRAKYGYADEDDDEDAESSGGFLPFATTSTRESTDPAATATLKSPVKRVYEHKPTATAPDSSASSASSAAAAPSHPTDTNMHKQKTSKGDYNTQVSPASALSPRHRSELSKLSPRMRKDGSEGTPSMGSSFSDLDGMFSNPPKDSSQDKCKRQVLMQNCYRCKYLSISHRGSVHESYTTWFWLYDQ
jgi:hypothetical protein